jgi:glucose dehydrogenase
MQSHAKLIRAGVLLAAAVATQRALAQNDWPGYGRDPGAQRFSPLKQIDPGNVAKLVEAWRFETRPAAETGNKRASGTTPLMVNGVLYLLLHTRAWWQWNQKRGKGYGRSTTNMLPAPRADSRTGRVTATVRRRFTLGQRTAS